MTAPGRSGTQQATIRGLIVLFVAVVVGIALLSRADSLVGSTKASNARPKSTTTRVISTTTPQSTKVPVNTGPVSAPAATHTPADVKVVVVNAAGGKAGVGKKNSALLTAAGFNVTAVKNGTTAAATTVFFAAGFQSDAAAVKTAIKVPTAKIAAAPATPILPETKAADVYVVFGQDYKG